MPYLSSADLERVVRAQRVFLSRPEFANSESYHLACNRALRDLLGADHTVFFEVNGDAALSSDDTDKEMLLTLGGRYKQLREPSVNSDPHLQAFVQARLERGPTVFIDTFAREKLERSPTYQDVFVPAGLNYLLGPSVATPTGELSILCAFEKDSARLYGEQGYQLIDLVLAAFGAGAHLHAAWRAGPDPLAAPLPLALLNTQGKELRRNEVFAQLAESDTGFGRVMAAAARSVKTLSEEPLTPRRRVSTGLAIYELRIALQGGAAEPRYLLSVSRQLGTLPDPGTLKTRYALTPRQVEVALLLAKGLTDKQIAENLGVSFNTARRHTEHTLKKLGLSTRAHVALTLLS